MHTEPLECQLSAEHNSNNNKELDAVETRKRVSPISGVGLCAGRMDYPGYPVPVVLMRAVEAGSSNAFWIKYDGKSSLRMQINENVFQDRINEAKGREP